MRVWSNDEIRQMHELLCDDINVPKIRKWPIILRKAVLDAHIEYALTKYSVTPTAEELTHMRDTMYKALMYK